MPNEEKEEKERILFCSNNPNASNSCDLPKKVFYEDFNTNEKFFKYKNSQINLKNNTDSRTTKFKEIAQSCIKYKNHPYKLRDLKQFLDYYTTFYDNIYSEFIKTITDFMNGKIESKIDFDYVLTENTIMQNQSFIVYRIINKEKNFKRIGFTSMHPIDRLANYFRKSFAPNIDIKKLNNYHRDLRSLINPNLVPYNSELQPLYAFNNVQDAKVMEMFLTIYENRADNELGYDLSINNEYNKIIGDLYLVIEGTLTGNINPAWKEVPVKDLLKFLKNGLTIPQIMKKFEIKHITTIHNRLRASNIGIKCNGTLFDARAYILKSIIEEAIMNAITEPEKFYQFARKKDVYIFDKYTNKSIFLRKICNYIWGEMLEDLPISKPEVKTMTLSRLRKIKIAQKIFQYAKNPTFNRITKVVEVMKENGYKFRFEREAEYICQWYFGHGYNIVQNNILRTILGKFLNQKSPELSNREITELMGLEFNYKNFHYIRQMIYRVFGALTGEVHRDLAVIKDLIRTGKLGF